MGFLYLTIVGGFSGFDLNRLYVCIFVCVHLSIDVLLELDNMICFGMLRGFPVINKEWKVVCSNSEFAAGLVWARGILNDELTETWIVCYLERKSCHLVGLQIGGWVLGPGAPGDLLPVAVRVRLNHIISASRSQRSDASSFSIQSPLSVVPG